MQLYAIRNYDNGVATGYFIGPHGPVIFASQWDARREAQKLNRLPHAAGRLYVAEPIRD